MISKRKNETPGRCWAVVHQVASRRRAKFRCGELRVAMTLTTGFQANAGVTDERLLTGGRMLTWSDRRQMMQFVQMVRRYLPKDEVEIFFKNDEIWNFRRRLGREGALRPTLAAKLAPKARSSHSSDRSTAARKRTLVRTR